MVKNSKILFKFELKLKTKLKIKEKYKILNSMYNLSKKFSGKKPLEGIEKDIKIARVINSV